MAVKYSKQRDFGAKGRKTRKMDKQMWKLETIHKLKSGANSFAKMKRKKGWKARVVKLSRGYGVYLHRK